MRYELRESYVRFSRWIFALSAALFLTPAVLVLSGFDELGWELALGIAVLWFHASLTMWRVVFRPGDCAVELTPRMIAGSSSRVVRWKDVAAIRSSRFAQRLELVAGDGTRVGVPFHLDGFIDVLVQIFNSTPELQPESTSEWTVRIPRWLRTMELAFVMAWTILVVFLWTQGLMGSALIATLMLLTATWLDRDEIRATSCASEQLHIKTRRGIRSVHLGADTAVSLFTTREPYGARALRVVVETGDEEIDVLPTAADPVHLYRRIWQSLPG